MVCRRASLADSIGERLGDDVVCRWRATGSRVEQEEWMRADSMQSCPPTQAVACNPARAPRPPNPQALASPHPPAAPHPSRGGKGGGRGRRDRHDCQRHFPGDPADVLLCICCRVRRRQAGGEATGVRLPSTARYSRELPRASSAPAAVPPSVFGTRPLPTRGVHRLANALATFTLSIFFL